MSEGVHARSQWRPVYGVGACSCMARIVNGILSEEACNSAILRCVTGGQSGRTGEGRQVLCGGGGSRGGCCCHLVWALRKAPLDFLLLHHCPDLPDIWRRCVLVCIAGLALSLHEG